MKEMMMGRILVENGILSEKTLERVLQISRRQKQRLGWTLEKMGLAQPEELTAALARQHNLTVVSDLAKFSYPQEVLKLVPEEVAIENMIFPLSLKASTLLIAVADPTDMKVLQNLAANLGLNVVPCLATRKEIHAAICRHYLKKEAGEAGANKVVVVEDERTCQELVRYSLVKAGYEVKVAEDGLSGFRTILSEMPQVIVTDMVMPKLDGRLLLEALKKIPELSSVPVLLMSDQLSPLEEMRVFEQGFFDYVTKPVDQIALLSRVKRAIKSHEHSWF